MTADGSHQRTPLHVRVDAFLSQFFARFTRRDPPEGPVPAADPTPLPFGGCDLALARLVHDLRNHLAVIAASADDLASCAQGLTAERDFLALKCSVERAAALTREMLRAHHYAEAPEFIDLNALIEACAGGLVRLAGPQIQLRLDLTPEPVVVGASRADLERILMNLVLNAREAMGYEGVLRISTAVVVEASCQRPGQLRTTRRARLVVSDTGCGMTPEVRTRIFEPFFTTKADGTGMGLSSVAATVQQLEGTLTVESQPGRGTSIEVHLPGAPRPV